jgi:DNA-binding HxlR family transcriptional regulator
MTAIENLDKAFESRVRLGIMSVLTASGQSDFNTLKGMLGVSDGNLASHIRALEELGYIETQKQFIGRKPNTSYSVTDVGRNAFSAHIEALSSLLGLK